MSSSFSNVSGAIILIQETKNLIFIPLEPFWERILSEGPKETKNVAQCMGMNLFLQFVLKNSFL